MSAGLGSRSTVFSGLQWAAILAPIKKRPGLEEGGMRAGKGKRGISDRKTKAGCEVEKEFFVCLHKEGKSGLHMVCSQFSVNFTEVEA